MAARLPLENSSMGAIAKSNGQKLDSMSLSTTALWSLDTPCDALETSFLCLLSDVWGLKERPFPLRPYSLGSYSFTSGNLTVQ